MLEISVQTDGFFDETQPEKSMLFIHDCGFDAVEYDILGHFPPHTILAEEKSPFFDQSIEELREYYKPIKEAACRYKVDIVQMHAPFPLCVGTQEYNAYLMRVMEKIFAVADFLGCPKLVIHPENHPSAVEREKNMQMFREMIPMAKTYGITICLENIFSYSDGHAIEGACSSAEEACWYIDKLNEEAGEDIFGCCFDIGHANIVGRKIGEHVKTLGKRLVALHIHETVGNTDSHMIPYTQPYFYNNQRSSWTDWEGFLEGLRAIQYEGPISFETYNGILFLPEEVRYEGYKLVSAIGRYFRDRING